jgi:anti-sigma regulatory factor (Ser/Thr protein kinase)
MTDKNAGDLTSGHSGLDATDTRSGVSPATRTLHLTVDGETSAPRRARRLARERLEHEVSPGTMNEVELIVGELVANSIDHGGVLAGEPIDVGLSLRGSVVRIEVRDEGFGGFRPALVRPPVAGASGHGLVIVDSLASRWGVRRHGGSTVVWAELPNDRR